MSEEQYLQRREAIMAKIDRLADTFADGRAKYPRALKAAMGELEKLEEERRRDD